MSFAQVGGSPALSVKTLCGPSSTYWMFPRSLTFLLLAIRSIAFGSILLELDRRQVVAQGRDVAAGQLGVVAVAELRAGGSRRT